MRLRRNYDFFFTYLIFVRPQILNLSGLLSLVTRKAVLGVLTRSKTNWPVRSQKRARNFWFKQKSVGLFINKIKVVDQRCSYYTCRNNSFVVIWLIQHEYTFLFTVLYQLLPMCNLCRLK